MTDLVALHRYYIWANRLRSLLSPTASVKNEWNTMTGGTTEEKKHWTDAVAGLTEKEQEAA